jgi:hypothetical protein
VAVCFICCSPDVLDGHNVCAEHHNPTYCRKCRTDFREGSGYVKKKSPGQTLFKTACMAALTELGGRATTGEVAAATGYTSAQVTASLRPAKGVRFELPTTGKRSNGLWCLEHDANSEPTAFEASEPLAA